ncbi:MAG: hypothetical protein KGV44_14945, partial [Flavobacteriaceae bacterium]|nr:hypothetical protein [Flavobacteriaceae bacterium]
MRLFNYKAILGVVFVLSGFFVQAQDVCTIKGVIKNDSLRFSQKKLEKIYLFSQDEYNRFNKV